MGYNLRIIISPAKKMNVDVDSLPPTELPQFLEETERLKSVLQCMSPEALQRLWRCNRAIADLNVARLQDMDLRRHLTPAILAYEGLQYRYLAPGVLEAESLAYLQAHLRILSGFYGVLRPFDGVVPYRLEMQAQLQVDGKSDLYAFWGSKLAEQLAAETDFVLNLASKEYSRAVQPYLPSSVRFLTCTFGTLVGGTVQENGTLCKMARGQMVRWLAQQQITCPDDIPAFSGLGYRFSPPHSTEQKLVFLLDND